MAKITTVVHPPRIRDWGPGREPQAVRDAYDQARAQREAEQERDARPEPQAEIS